MNSVLPVRYVLYDLLEESMEWHPSGVTRTKIRVVGVNFSEFLIKGKEIYFELAGNSNYPSSS